MRKSKNRNLFIGLIALVFAFGLLGYGLYKDRAHELRAVDYWFLGHYHCNHIVDDRFVIQWEQMSELKWE